MTSPLGVIKPKAMKNDKGREGVKKLEKWVDVIYGWPLVILKALHKRKARVPYKKILIFL